MVALLLDVYQDWSCPNCGKTERTPGVPANATRFHPCPKLHGLTAPMVRDGTDCKVTAVEREEYLGGAIQRTGDNGRPYMAVETERADGSTDRAVFPECAVQAAVS
jgi:hypothetical protein